MATHTAYLDDVTLILDGDIRAPCLNGSISGDINGRFQDGVRVTTSTLTEHIGGPLFRTRNSIYHVRSWGSPPK